MSYKKLRVIVRPWQPKNLPFKLTQSQLKEFIEAHAEEFAAVLYLGWVRRSVNGTTTVRFIVATAENRSDAKQRFKESNRFGEEVWDLTPASTQSDPLQPPDYE